MDIQFTCHKLLISIIQKHLKKIEGHCDEIGLPYSEFEKQSEIIFRKIVRETMDFEKDIENQKGQLLNEIKENIKKVNLLCGHLHMDPQPFLPRESSPYDSWLSIKKQISILNEKKKKIELDEFYKLKDHFLHLLNIVKKDLDEVEKHIVEFKPGDALDVPFDLLKEKISKLEDLKVSNKERNIQLHMEITQISESLKVDEMLPDTNDPIYFQSNTALEFQKTLDRLQAMRRSQVKLLSDNVRREIKILWERCNLSEECKQSCKSFYSVNDEDEDNLCELEEYLCKLQWVASQLVSIDDRIKLYCSQFHELQEVEARLSNPDKFLNRGGRMLKDETLKKKLFNSLPKAEAEITQDIQNLSESVDLNMRVDLLTFSEDCKIRWQEYHDKKSIEIQTRHKNKVNTLNQDLRYGSKPVPVSKKHVAGHALKDTEEAKKKVILKPSVKVNNPTMYAVARFSDDCRSNKRTIDHTVTSTPIENQIKKFKHEEN